MKSLKLIVIALLLSGCAGQKVPTGTLTCRLAEATLSAYRARAEAGTPSPQEIADANAAAVFLSQTCGWIYETEWAIAQGNETTRGVGVMVRAPKRDANGVIIVNPPK